MYLLQLKFLQQLLLDYFQVKQNYLIINFYLAARVAPDQLGKTSKDAAQSIENLIKVTKETVSSEKVENIKAPPEFLEISKQIISNTKMIVDAAGDKNQVFLHARNLAQANISVDN